MKGHKIGRLLALSRKRIFNSEQASTAERTKKVPQRERQKKLKKKSYGKQRALKENYNRFTLLKISARIVGRNFFDRKSKWL